LGTKGRATLGGLRDNKGVKCSTLGSEEILRGPEARATHGRPAQATPLWRIEFPLILRFQRFAQRWFAIIWAPATAPFSADPNKVEHSTGRRAKVQVCPPSETLRLPRSRRCSRTMKTSGGCPLDSHVLIHVSIMSTLDKVSAPHPFKLLEILVLIPSPTYYSRSEQGS
jgi:hypothetical protein